MGNQSSTILNTYRNKTVKSKKKIDMQKKITFAMFTAPGLILYSIFFIGPICMGIYYSLTNWNGISRSYKYIGFENYVTVLSDDRFLKALIFNAKYSLLLIISIITLAMVLALLLNNKIKGLTFYRASLFLPAVLSMLTVGLIFNQIYFRAIPPIGKLLGIEALSKNILANPKMAIYAVLFVHVWQGVAMPTILLLAGLQTIPSELYESAAIDGASGFERFKSITIPFILPVLSVVLVLVLKSGIMVFDYIMSLTEGGPGGATESIGMLIYTHGMAEQKFSYSIAEAIIIAIIICLISFIQISYTNKKKVY